MSNNRVAKGRGDHGNRRSAERIATIHGEAILKFTRESQSANTVRKVEPGSVTIGETVYRESIGLLAENVIERWPDRPLPELDEDCLAPILDSHPELLIIGTGWKPVLPPRELMFAMARRGIGFEVMDTPAACRTFNILIGEDRRPAAILYLDS